jgi:predicted ester cyclase
VADPKLDGVRDFWEQAFNGRDLDAVDRLFAENYVNHATVEGAAQGREGQRQLMQRLWTAFPDARFTIEHLAADGDTVICVGTMEGTHEGELMGMAPTGRRVAWRQCHLMLVDESGRAVEHRAIRDDAGLFRQIGAGPGG